MRSALVLIAGAAILALALPAAAAPLSTAALNCAFDNTAKDVATLAIGVVVDEPASAESEAAMETLNATIATCADKHGVPEAQRADYRAYSIVRVMRPIYASELTKAGFPLAKIDAMFDVGPGRANTIDEIPQEKVAPLLKMLGDGGMDVNAVTSRTWTMLGAYIGATSILGRRELTLKAG